MVLMNLELLYLVLGVVLAVVTWQDLKYRVIHFLLPLTICIISLGINYYSNELSIIMFAKNIGFISINVLGLVLYYSIREKKIINPINSMIGLGDVLFFLAIAPLFDLKSYILFFIVGMIFSLVIHLFVNTIKKQKTVPLAGYLAIMLVVFLGLKYGFNLNIF